MKKRFLIPTLALVSISSISSASAEMTDVQRDDLVKKLDALINKSQATLTGRQAVAYRAYKQGLSSSTEALELYLKCIEKVDFIEAGKKSSDFRDWKRKEKEKLSQPGFRLALRHQLNWLVLTIDAARSEEEGDYSALSSRAQSSIDNIFDDANKLGGHHGILKQDVLSSVFSKAYGFGSFKVKDWPTTPLNVPDVYEKVIFPPLRESKKASSLRSAWQQRISYQEDELEHWAPKPQSKTIGMKKDLKPPAYYKFVETKRPELIWKMEKEVFEAGDEYGAASRMIAHLSKHIDHNNATQWAKELQTLISGDEEDIIAQEDNALSETESTNTNESNNGYIELSAE